MSHEIAAVLEELRQDHRNMSDLLDHLEHETERVRSGEDPDFELVHDIMQYMTVYPDAVHHPKEDRIYAELEATRPDLAEGLSRIAGEHCTIAEQSVALRDKVEQAIAGDFVRRDEVVADATRYIDSLRKHMHWEEADLFQRVDRMIADGHTVLDKSILERKDDPLFGARVEERFERLRESTRRI